ncbi:hotdog family protein [Photobacterium alginatilyticum]|uniref:3-hydroxydecanoyl-ACP dehydratase n=1 Tax=Photobacterium alginatilyticum TaxID=1775171 RepID=A0ABW9YE99_9GAMM|nr:hotdog family protein [Photobacterium alginatilyticum]NBI51962.1 3-hydroxydecanoyl-ACP dehydratase [Photobacterium alginatilyticum]
MAEYPHLHQLLPHESSMVLVDELVDVGDNHVHCRVIVGEQNLFFDTESRAIPGYVGVELMAQTVAGWSGYHAANRGEASPVGFLLGCRRYQAECSAFEENQALDIYAEQVMENNGMAVFACRIEHQGNLLASSQLNLFIPSKKKLEQTIKKDPI